MQDSHKKSKWKITSNAIRYKYTDYSANFNCALLRKVRGKQCDSHIFRGLNMSCLCQQDSTNRE